MADAGVTTKDEQKKQLKVPPDIVARFGELIELIRNSRSMDDSERQYWVDVLPIMSEDQIQNLRDILDNEKKQLKEAEAAYSEGMKDNFLKTSKAFDAEAYEAKKRARREAEKHHEIEEKQREASILQELEKL